MGSTGIWTRDLLHPKQTIEPLVTIRTFYMNKFIIEQLNKDKFYISYLHNYSSTVQ